MKKVTMMLALLCVAAFAQQKGSFTDSRDGKTYKTVKIGSQVWMAENLDYAASDSKYYNNNPIYCDRYGRLYDWNTAFVVCPKGWHLPSNAEWGVLKKNVNSACSSAKNCLSAASLLKATSGWKGYGNGEDKYGFAALPGGFGLAGRYNDFSNVGDNADWWSASEHTDGWGDIDGYLYYLGRDNENNPALLSVRCVRD